MEQRTTQRFGADAAAEQSELDVYLPGMVSLDGVARIERFLTSLFRRRGDLRIDTLLRR